MNIQVGRLAMSFGTAHPDGGWSLNDDCECAEYRYPTRRRDEIEEALRQLGFTIVHDDVLINAYWYGAEYAGGSERESS